MSTGKVVPAGERAARAVALAKCVFSARLSGRSFDGIGRLLASSSPGPLVGIAVGVGAAALSVSLRFCVTPFIGDGEALLTAFPAILMAALTTGAWGGWTCLVLTTVCSWYLFIGDRFSFSFGPLEPGILIGTFLAGAFVIQISRLMRGMFREIAALRAAERLMSRELEHRIKNTLTLVMAIGRQTFREPRSMASALEDFDGRMLALSAAQNIAGVGERGPAAIEVIAKRSLAPFCGGSPDDRLSVSGSEVIVDVDRSVALFLIFHELATNSAKYGSLSTAGGGVEITWRADTVLGLVVTWVDHDGPPVTPPTSEGFGSKLIERIVKAQLKGTVAVRYPRSGIQVVIAMPI